MQGQFRIPLRELRAAWIVTLPAPLRALSLSGPAPSSSPRRSTRTPRSRARSPTGSATLPDDAFAAPSVLPGWDVRTLVGHIVLHASAGLAAWLHDPGHARARRSRSPSTSAPTAAAADDIDGRTRAVTGDADRRPS